MDHMRISGNESSSVILRQIKWLQKEKMPKRAEAKRDCVINPQNYNFNQFNTEYFDALKCYESTDNIKSKIPIKTMKLQNKTMASQKH